MNKVLSFSICAVFICGLSACSADNGGAAQKPEKTAVVAINKAKNTAKNTAAGKKSKEANIKVQKKSSAEKAKYKKINNEWFSFQTPLAWNAILNPEEDAQWKVYEAKITLPSGKKFSSYIHVSYFAEDNEDIATYQNFINVNSQNTLLGARDPKIEQYEPVEEKQIAGRKAFVMARVRRHFLHPNSKNDDYIMLKEKLYVFPAEKGYYVLRYGADETVFADNIQAFEKLTASFKGKY